MGGAALGVPSAKEARTEIESLGAEVLSLLHSS